MASFLPWFVVALICWAAIFWLITRGFKAIQRREDQKFKEKVERYPRDIR